MADPCGTLLAMRYVSTEGRAPAVDLAEAVWRGLAPDGGLYVPDHVPRLPDAVWQDLLDRAELVEIASTLLAPYLEDTLEPDERERLVAETFTFPIPLTPLHEGPGQVWLLELFHGPTLAFKDVGARLLARLLPRVAPPGEQPVTVLVATSGDTGGAVARAFHGVAGTRVVVLYPRGQVSPRQERQFATLGGNVLAVAVEGTFDDCQRLAKEAFADAELTRELRLTSANSINLGRLLPQMTYYAHGAAQLRRTGQGRRPRFVVPSGNFGNLTAGLLAARMGLPCRRPFVAACNANDVVPEFLATGVFHPRPSVATLANAMDVGNPSNLARIRALFGAPESEDEAPALCHWITARSFDDDAIRRAIRNVHRETGRVLDPHTAVGWLAWRDALERGEIAAEEPAVILATAHPAKFGEVVAPEVGGEPPPPAALAEVMDRPLRNETAPANAASLREVMRAHRWEG